VPRAMLVEVCSELHIPALHSWFGGTAAAWHPWADTTQARKARSPGKATPTRRSVCWGGLEMDGGEAVDQAMNVRGRKGSSNG